jgi:hypothetical protein
MRKQEQDFVVWFSVEGSSWQGEDIRKRHEGRTFGGVGETMTSGRKLWFKSRLSHFLPFHLSKPNLFWELQTMHVTFLAQDHDRYIYLIPVLPSPFLKD